MPKKKEHCPSCTTRTITINPCNYETIKDEQHRLNKLKRPLSDRTFEKVLNRIISEWALWKDHQEIKK